MHATIALGVNIDHVATLRQQRQTRYPEPLQAALLAEQAGADSITLHLREDRRHIQERDVRLLAELIGTRMNLEMAATAPMLQLACALRPADCCLVPERRAELTTEGGLDVAAGATRLAEQCAQLAGAGIRVALFIDPDAAQVQAAAAARVPVVELHTGAYADARGAAQARELQRLQAAAQLAASRAAWRSRASSCACAAPRPSAKVPVCSSTTGTPAAAAASICAGSGSMNNDTRMPRAARRAQRCTSAGPASITFRPPSVVSSARRSGTRQQSAGASAQASSIIGSVAAISRFMRVASSGTSARTSRSWMWRRSSRRCSVMLSAPACSASSAAYTGSG